MIKPSDTAATRMRNAAAAPPIPLWRQLVADIWSRPDMLNLCADLMGLLALLALSAAVLIGINRLPVLPLTHVDVDMPLRGVPRAALETAARAGAVGNFFTVDLNRARVRIEQTPWVRRAYVRRLWPDGLAVSIEEQSPVARWQPALVTTINPSSHEALQSGEDSNFLVNDYGEVFDGGQEFEAAALPSLSGPPGTSAKMLQRWREFSKILTPIQATPSALTLSPRLAWVLKLSGGLVIELGRDHPEANASTERLRRFVTYYPLAHQQLNLKASVADMRYPGGFALYPDQSSPKTSKVRS
jgi:cell division protein FtsQ